MRQQSPRPCGAVTLVNLRARLIGQLKMVYADDPTRAQMFGDLIRTVSRDEVLVVD